MFLGRVLSVIVDNPSLSSNYHPLYNRRRLYKWVLVLNNEYKKNIAILLGGTTTGMSALPWT